MTANEVARDPDFDWRIREHIYQTIAGRGTPPTCSETAAAVGLGVQVIEAAYQRLDDAHALFLQPGTLDIHMAHPFSGVETNYRVCANGVDYWANCAWDVFGIPAALNADAEMEFPETGTNAQIAMAIERGEPVGWDGVVHLSVPFRNWYDDLVHT